MTARHATRAMALVALFGCDGYRLVEPGRAGARARLDVNLVVEVTDSARYRLRAYYGLGPDSLGRPVPLSDQRIVVDGVAVAPARTNVFGSLEYAWTATRPTTGSGVGADSIMVRGPVPERGEPATLTLYPVTRDGPAEIMLGPPGDLVLRVRTAGSVLPRESSNWSLTVSPPRTGDLVLGFYSLSVMGAVPAEIRVPRTALPDTLLTLSAMLNTSSFTRTSGTAVYPATAFYGSAVQWTVRRVP